MNRKKQAMAICILIVTLFVLSCGTSSPLTPNPTTIDSLTSETDPTSVITTSTPLTANEAVLSPIMVVVIGVGIILLVSLIAYYFRRQSA